MSVDPTQTAQSPAALDPATLSPTRFGYWVPNVSGGLVTSDIEQRTNFTPEYNLRLARLAEQSGFDYALTQVRYLSSYGAEEQHESTSFSIALLQATERLRVIAAVHPGLWHPAILAKLGTTASHLSGGRFAVNVVSGWFKQEFTALGEPWLEHDERYRRAEEFITALRTVWTKESGQFAGDFYRLRDVTFKPRPVTQDGLAHPEIFQGGNSTAARGMAGRVSDWYFSNGTDLDGVAEQRRDIAEAAAVAGRRPPRFGLNGFIVVRDSEAEAHEVIREIVAKTNKPALQGFREAVRQAGAATADGKGMWAGSSDVDLVQYNDGFRTGLIGTPEQVAQRIVTLRRHGVDLILGGFLHFVEDVEQFGRQVIPLVRHLEDEIGIGADLDPSAAADHPAPAAAH